MQQRCRSLVIRDCNRGAVLSEGYLMRHKPLLPHWPAALLCVTWLAGGLLQKVISMIQYGGIDKWMTITYRVITCGMWTWFAYVEGFQSDRKGRIAWVHTPGKNQASCPCASYATDRTAEKDGSVRTMKCSMSP